LRELGLNLYIDPDFIVDAEERKMLEKEIREIEEEELEEDEDEVI
jgi:hypothetical protein